MTNLWVDPKTFDKTCTAYRRKLKPHMVTLAQFGQRRRAEMAQVVDTEATYVTCRFCGSENVVKYGIRRGTQYYWCKNCERKFSGADALPGMRYPPDAIATAMSLFYEGLSLNEIGRTISQIHGKAQPSDSTIYEWVVRFTKQAIELSKAYKAQTGPIWAADETVINVGGSRTRVGSENTIWFWDVIDTESRFLLASHLSERRTISDARLLFTRAASRVRKPPRQIVTDHLKAYIDGIERVFGADAQHIQSGPFVADLDGESTRAIERFHGTLKDRVKVMRGMQNRDTAELVLNGWLIHYNFFRPHSGLRFVQTPGDAARVGFPHRNWKDVVYAGVPQHA